MQQTPGRPALPAGADTCDPNVYYQYALTQLGSHPDRAAAAYYWMQRLAPISPIGYYSERVALLLADQRLLRGYMEEDRRTLQSAKVTRLDALMVQAIILDPFFPQFLDEDLIGSYLTSVLQSRGGGDRLRTYLGFMLAMDDSATRAWLAYSRGNYSHAADYWAARLRHDSLDTHLRAWRAKALFLAGQWDSAHAEIETALRLARRSDAQRMRYVYDSKVLWEYALGWIDEQQKRDSAARDEYESTLVEDLSFYPAHLRLAYLALGTRDTARAVTELQRALEINEADFASRLLLGAVQAARRAFSSATEQLRRAAEIEPWVAYPHFLLGRVLAEAGDREGAAAEYRRFLALAARSDPDVGAARQRLAALSAPAP